MELFEVSLMVEKLLVFLMNGYYNPEHHLIDVYGLKLNRDVDGNSIDTGDYAIKHPSLPNAQTFYVSIQFPTKSQLGLIRLEKLSAVNHQDEIVQQNVQNFKLIYLTAHCPVRIHPVHWRTWKLYKDNALSFDNALLYAKILVIKHRGIIIYPHSIS